MEFAYTIGSGDARVIKYIADDAATINPGVPLQSAGKLPTKTG